MSCARLPCADEAFPDRFRVQLEPGLRGEGRGVWCAGAEDGGLLKGGNVGAGSGRESRGRGFS